MKSEIKKIEDRIRRMLQQEKSARITKTSIKKKLSSQGFKLSDIEVALNRVWKNHTARKRRLTTKFPKASLATLVLPEKELKRFTTEGYQGLQRLYNSKILDYPDLAQVYHMLDHSWGKIDLEKLVHVLIDVLSEKYSYEALKVIVGVAVGEETAFC